MAEKGERWQTGSTPTTRKPAIMKLRIRISAETVKQLLNALHKAYKSGDSRMVKRLAVLLEFSHGDSPSEIASQHGIGVSTIDDWLKPLLSDGLNRLKPQWRGGRPRKLTDRQRQQLSQWLQAGPPAAGDPTGCWSALLVQALIQPEFGVRYNAHSRSERLRHLGCSYPKARLVSDHLDEVKRLCWLTQGFPDCKRRAQAVGGWLRLGDEASLAQSGSLGDPWAPVGQPPTVQTSGKRRADQVFGLMECFSRQRFDQGVEGKFNASSSSAFLKSILDHRQHRLFLVQAGAK